MRPPRSPWDAAWKALIQQVFHPWLAYFFPDVAAVVDPDHPPEFLDTELQKIAPAAARGRSHVDRLVRVGLLTGEPALLLIYVEIQSQEDAKFPHRLLLYHITLHLHYGVPLCTLALLADPAPNWRPSRCEIAAPATRLTLEFGVCKLADLEPGPERVGEPLLNHVVRAWRLARGTTGDAALRKAGKLSLVRALVDAARAEGCDRVQAAAALRFLESVAVLPDRLEEQYLAERNFMTMEIENFEPLTYAEKKAWREGRQEGRQEGRREGRQEGHRAAQHESAHRMSRLGLDVTTIAEALGLTEPQVQSLLEGSPEG